MQQAHFKIQKKCLFFSLKYLYKTNFLHAYSESTKRFLYRNNRHNRMRTRSRIMCDLFAERAHIGLAQERKEHLTAQIPCQMHFEIRHLVETNVSAHSDFWRPIFILHVYMATETFNFRRL